MTLEEKLNIALSRDDIGRKIKHCVEMKEEKM
jgi:hypothetical protein